MRLGGVLQRIGLVDLDLDGARLHDLEQFLGHGHKVFALGAIGIERRPGDIERTLLRQKAEVKRIDTPGGLPEQREVSQRRQAIQRFQERILADGIVNHWHLVASGDLVDTLYEIFPRVDDGVSAAVGLGKLCLLVAADRADHGDAEMLGPLAEDQADTPRRGVQQNGLAGFDPIGLADEILHRQALQHHRRGCLVVNVVGQLDQAIRWNQPLIGIGAGRCASIGDAVAGFQIGDAGPGLLDNASRLAAEPARQRDRIKSGPVVDIYKVQSHRGVPDARFARAGLAQFDFLPDQNFRPAGFMKANGMRHGVIPRVR